jgi:hypothetical protein
MKNITKHASEKKRMRSPLTSFGTHSTIKKYP